jgi:phosphatidate phosphatase PAH1
MDTIKKVFSEAYYPEKYMKDDDEVNNSINYAHPVESNASNSRILEEVKQFDSEQDRESSFHYEGGDQTLNFDSSKDATYKHALPPIKTEEVKNFYPDLSDNIFNNSNSLRSKTNKPVYSDHDS